MSVLLTEEEVDAVRNLLEQYAYDGHPWDEDLTNLENKLKKAKQNHGR